VFFPACLYGWNIHKAWIFASSFFPVRDLGGQCSHQPGAHESIQGKIDAWGNFESRKTACYPKPLADQFATIIQPLLQFSSRFLLVIPSTIGSKENDSRFSNFLRRMGAVFFPPQTGAKQIEANQMFFNRCVTHGFNILFTIDWTRLYFNILFPTIPILHFLMKFCSHSDMTLNNFYVLTMKPLIGQ
jgi:hypothetical protein